MTTTTTTTTRSDIADIYRLTPMQLGMLVRSVAGARAADYVVQWCGTITRRIDPAAVANAYQRVVDRHPVLRTCLVWEGLDEPVQVVRRQVAPPLEWLDWRGLTPAEQARRFDAFVEADSARGFDLHRAPLLRITIIHLTDETAHFVWSFHHLLLDGWAAYLVARELAYYLAAFSQAGPVVDLPRPRPYREFVGWLQRADLSSAEAYWRAQLAGFRTPTLLEDLRHTVPSSPGAGLTFEAELSATLTRALEIVARRHQVTLSVLLHAAWALLLSHHSGQSDVLFGIAVSGRPLELEGSESMVGLFLNTLPLRVRVPADAWLPDWLVTLQAQESELRQFETTPLVSIQSWSPLPAGAPLFQTMVTIQNFFVDASIHEDGALLELGDDQRLTFTNTRLLSRSEYPLALRARTGRQVWLEFVYDAARVAAPTIERLAGHYQALLEAIAANPMRRLGDLPLVAGAERLRILLDWNATVQPESGPCVAELVAEQARRQPDALAVATDDRTLRYGALDRQAAALAARLRRLGVGPDVIVGVCAERSPELIVGELGVLMAGGAYLPLDPAYPRDRLAFMLADAGVRVLLVDQPGRDDGLAFGGTVINLADLADDDGVPSAPAPADPDSLAYVIYTSGSTGQPKGVAVPQRGLRNLVAWHRRTYALGPADRATLLASVSFDASAWELWPYLAAGASIHIPDDAVRADPRRLVDWLAEQRISLAFLPTPLAEAAFDGLEQRAGALALRALLVGGDVLHRAPADHSGWRLSNHYGPTESSVVATAGEVLPVTGQRMPPSIGRPIDNTRVYVLDAQLRPVPVGVTGELYLAGGGLARGYLGRPRLTAERFVPDPFSAVPGGRLYRTGDLVRWTATGELDFAGRLDQQVKVRGFRIELGEIEAVLGQHPLVHQAAVVADTSRPGDTRLVAYVVASSDLSLDALRSHLRAHLPAFMQPSAVVFVAHLPLTANGKVDRTALPSPTPQASSTYVAPRTPLEQRIVAIWQAVLDVERVGVEDNFFDVGGNSLLLTEIAARLCATLEREIPIVDLFEHPTVALLAVHLEPATDPGASLHEAEARGAERTARLAQRARAREVITP